MIDTVLSVLEFHEAMGCTIGDPRKPDITVEQEHRLELLDEELQELKDALAAKDVVAVADALGDILYVTAGAGIAWGIDLTNVFDVIHTSNMTKTPSVKRGDGKVLKGPKYKPPDIAGALAASKRMVEKDGFSDDTFWPVPTNIRQPFRDALAVEAEAQIEAAPQPNGYFASHYYVFECPCGRTHSISTQQGTRGGWRKSAETTCICGKQFAFTFTPPRSGQEPQAQVVITEPLQ